MIRFGLAFVLALLASAPAIAEGKKNIVLFVCDDLGFQLGCYGDKSARTPNIDRLAAEGVKFTHAFCTTASCSASRSVILTGLHNHANGQFGHAHAEHHFSIHDKVPTLPVMLADAGYRTGLCGKLHVAPEEAFKFDTVIKANQRNAVAMAMASRAFITEKSDKPFFLYFCPADPHRSNGTIQIGEEKSDRFGNIDAGFPNVNEQKFTPDEITVPPFLPDSSACRAELSQYYQSVARVDQGVGRLREILKQAGVEKETLIIFTSDNGIAFPGAKTTLYEPGMNLPMIAYLPDATNERHVCNAMISWVDLTPTLLDYAGAASPLAKFHGRSFLKAMNEESPAGWDEVFASHTFHEITMYYPMRVVRDRRYKLIWNIAHKLDYPFASDLWSSITWQDAAKKGEDSTYGKRRIGDYIHRPAFELYDLEADPDEVKNLAADPEHAKRLDEMKGKIKTFQEKTADIWALKWKYE